MPTEETESRCQDEELPSRIGTNQRKTGRNSVTPVPVIYKKNAKDPERNIFCMLLEQEKSWLEAEKSRLRRSRVVLANGCGGWPERAQSPRSGAR